MLSVGQGSSSHEHLRYPVRRQKTLLSRLGVYWGKSIGDNTSGLAWNSRIGTAFPEAISSVFSSIILAPQLSHQPSQPCDWPNQVRVLLPGYFFCFWRAGYVQCFLHTWKPLSRNPLTGIQMGRHTPQRRGMWTWGIQPHLCDSLCRWGRFTHPV